MKPAGAGAQSHFPLSGVRVLVADDDRIPRRIVSAAIIRAGGEPIEAEDGAAVLELAAAAADAFDAVVLDFVMPGLDGADLVRALRSLGFSGPVLGYSGAATDGETAAWLSAGCDEVLPKGCPMSELIMELTATYRRRQNVRCRRFFE